MTGRAKTSEEVLGDSEATLRLVDSLLDDLREGDEIVKRESERVMTVVDEVSTSPGALAQLPDVLLRAYSEIEAALETLRNSRGVLEQATLERIQRTQTNLKEVSSATEKAATDMLDGLDRALLLIDRLDSSMEGGSGEEGDQEGGSGHGVADAGAIKAELRDELFDLISSLQFQDITSQQLRYASRVLAEIEVRLVSIADLFDLGLTQLDGGGAATPRTPAEDDAADIDESGTGGAVDPGLDAEIFTPAATMLDPEGRQALADEIFTPQKPGDE